MCQKCLRLTISELYENQLNINDADYYLTVNEGLELENSHPIKRFGVII